MVSYSENVTNGTWVNVVSDEDYVLQNKGKGTGRVQIKASVGEPTDSEGAIDLYPGDVIASTVLTGNLWVKALTDDVLIAYAK